VGFFICLKSIYEGMKLQKTKTYPFSLNEYKKHLRYSESENYFNDEVRTLIKDSFDQIEGDIQMDVVPTVTSLTDYCIKKDTYWIKQPNVVVTGITATSCTGVVSVITGYSYLYFQHSTLLKFDECVDAEILNITYSSGSSTPPLRLMRASKLLVGYYHDVDRSTIATGSHRPTEAYYRLISPFIHI
jgi:hypothetical protein